MKSIETALFAASLVLLPAMAWLAGRAMGRRDWPIAAILVAGCAVAAIPYAARLAFAAAMTGAPFLEALQREAVKSLDNLEVGFFFVTLSLFVTMLGWTATPVSSERSASDRDPRAR